MKFTHFLLSSLFWNFLYFHLFMWVKSKTKAQYHVLPNTLGKPTEPQMTWPHGLLPILFQRIIKSPRQTTLLIMKTRQHSYLSLERGFEVPARLWDSSLRNRGHTTFSSLQSLPPTLFSPMFQAQPPYDPVCHAVAPVGLWVHPAKKLLSITPVDCVWPSPET